MRRIDFRAFPIFLAKAFLSAIVLGFLVQAVSERWFWPQLWPKEFNVGEAFNSFGDTVPLLWTTFMIAAAVSIVGVFLSAPLSWLLYNSKPMYRMSLIVLLLFPALIPPAVSGIGYSIWFLKIDFDGNTIAVIAAHLLISLPYMVGIVLSVLFRQDRGLFETSAGLGWSADHIFFRVAVPLMKSGLYLAAFVGFTISWGQYLLTVLVGNGQVVTLPMIVVSLASSPDQTRFAALVLVTVLVPTLAAFAYRAILSKSEGKKFC